MAGNSHRDISFGIGISAGTVSTILQECRKGGVTDIDLLRSVAVEMKKQRIGINDLAFSMRLRNMLNIFELPEEKVEKFLLALSIYNYKNDIEDPERFISEIEKVSEYVARLDVSVFDIVDFIEKMKTKLKKLDTEILGAELKLAGLKYEKEQLMLKYEKSKDSKIIKDADSTQ